jgi:lipoprotein-anchoring transpeptidase ErfK/SrfK
MRSTSGRMTRALALVAGTATIVLGSAVPARAVPTPVTDLAATLGPHGLQLTWTNPGAGAPIVRDVTGETAPYDPAGTQLTGTATTGCPTSTCLYDGSFTNATSRTYAVWATDDGSAASASLAPAVQSFGPLPALPTALTLAVSATSVVYNKAITLTGSVTRGGLPFPGASVQLLSGVLGKAPALLKTVTSGLDGSIKVVYTPTRSRTYRLHLVEDAFSSASDSPTRTVLLAPRVPLALSAATVQWKQTSTLRGTVSPNLAGQTVSLQRLTSLGWRTVGRSVLTSTSTYSVAQLMPVGRFTYRAVLPATTDHLTGVSGSVVLTVVPRTLVQGNTGPDVLAMKTRLAALHYDVGTVNSTFDYSTRHGVTAFQKVEGLARTGKWTSVERTRAAHPRGFRVRYHDSRLTAEVDITKQVMVLTRNGVISRIVDVSTGSEKPYYQDGVKYVAHTPRGVFSIYRKIDGIRVSKLGELYRPSYFYRGWAIHGSGSVPTYPASHGCVRITNPVADRLFAVLKIGTRVAVYDE